MLMKKFTFNGDYALTLRIRRILCAVAFVFQFLGLFLRIEDVIPFACVTVHDYSSLCQSPSLLLGNPLRLCR